MPTEKILNLDKAEQILLRVSKHPFGLASIVFGSATAIVTLLVLLFVSLSSLQEFDVPEAVIITAFTISILLVALFGYIGAYLYKENELVITNENIIQVLQFGLFNRQVSQLNLSKIQDVSVDEVGLFSRIFHYGTIEIETAGEKSNYRFTYTPEPNKVAKIIIEAHEDYSRRHGARHDV